MTDEIKQSAAKGEPVVIPRDVARRLFYKLIELEDEGPVESGWQSKQLKSDIKVLIYAINEEEVLRWK